MESQFTFYNALLPSVSTPETIGRVSGFSWAAGYIGAIVCLVLALTLFILPETPLWGLDKASAEHVRVTMPLAAAWFLVFAIPLFLWVPEGAAEAGETGVVASLLEGLRTARAIPGLLRFLIARMIYADGLVVVFAFGGIYATNVFGFAHNDVIVFAIAINITAGVGGGVHRLAGGSHWRFQYRAALPRLPLDSGCCRAAVAEPSLLLDRRSAAGVFCRPGAIRQPYSGRTHRAASASGSHFWALYDFPARRRRLPVRCSTACSSPRLARIAPAWWCRWRFLSLAWRC